MKRPFLLGLTGSVGMGKSTTARLFKEVGVPVWDADAVVHRIYQKDGAGVGPIAHLAPEAIRDGAVDRAELRTAVLSDPELLGQVERAIHPIVQADRQRFISENETAMLIVCDIPLLFETGAEAWLDAILVVTAPPAVQRRRVLERSGMTEDVLDAILARQLPDSEKRARADYVIATDRGMEAARTEVLAVIENIQKRTADA